MIKSLSHPSPIGATTHDIETFANMFRGLNIHKFNGSPSRLIREMGGKEKDDLRGDLMWSVDEGYFYYPSFNMLSIRARDRQYAAIIGLQVMHAPLFRVEHPDVIMRVNTSKPSLRTVMREAIIFGNELLLPHERVLELYEQGGCDAVRLELNINFVSTEEIEKRVEYARKKLEAPVDKPSSPAL